MGTWKGEGLREGERWHRANWFQTRPRADREARKMRAQYPDQSVRVVPDRLSADDARTVYWIERSTGR